MARTRPETEMLDAYVIEEIKRRERDRSREDRPVVELPVPPSVPGHGTEHEGEDGGGDHDRGVVIIDYSS
jgi:hypothetical protein